MTRETDARSEAELNAVIETARAGLTDTLQSLTYELQPEVQLEKAKESATKKVDELKEEISETFRGVLQGDRDSIVRVAKFTGLSFAAIALLVLRSKRRRIRRGEVQQWRRLVKQLGKMTPPANLTITVQ